MLLNYSANKKNKKVNYKHIPRGFPATCWLCGETPQQVFPALFWGHCQGTHLGFPVRLPCVFGNDSQTAVVRLKQIVTCQLV